MFTTTVTSIPAEIANQRYQRNRGLIKDKTGVKNSGKPDYSRPKRLRDQHVSEKHKYLYLTGLF